MALIPYQYNATTDDLWLYRNEQTVPYVNLEEQTVVSTFKTPYAWNPGSPLYPYRRSIEGIFAPYRTFSTSAAEEAPIYADYLPFNPGLVGRNPVFYNSYPPTRFLLNSRAVTICSHCEGPPQFRDPTKTWRDFRGNGYLNAVSPLRFIDGDDNQVNIPTEDFLRPYSKDPAYPAGLLISSNDRAWTELTYDIPIRPIQAVTLLDGCPQNAKAWYIDGSSKIIPAQCHYGYYKDYAVSPNPSDARLLATSTAFSESGLPIQNYEHDSGSFCLVEVKRPTSAEAGDGIVALVLHMVYSTNDFVRPQSMSASDFRPSSPTYQYWVNDRGLSLPPLMDAIPSDLYPVASSSDGQTLLSQSQSLQGSIT